MTCIVGIAENGKVFVGGDSAGVAGLSLEIRADKKVFKEKDFICGFTSSFRMGQLIQFKFKLPRLPEEINEETMMKYMVSEFIENMRNCFREGGYLKKEKEEEGGGCFLIGIKGFLYKIDTDFQVGKLIKNYTAVGCGDHLALGSLFSTEDQEAEVRIMMALKAAEQYSAGVREPFYIESI